MKIKALAIACLGLTACGGKYVVKSFPSDAKLYIKDIRTNEKKLVGNTPTSIEEDPRLGEVFFVVLEKENYKPKEIMLKVNEGESLTVAAKLDPLLVGDGSENQVAKKDDDQKPQQGGKPDEKPKDWQKEMDDMKMRIALLENTTSFYKDALFSPRLSGGLPAHDRDRNETVVGNIFKAQQSIMKGKYDEALQSIDKATQLDEYATNAWLLKGSVKYLLKDFQGARLAWEQTLKLDPYNKVAFKYLNNVYKVLKVEPLTENPATLRQPASTLEINQRRRANAQ